MKKWSYKISVRDVNKKFIPFYFEYSIENIEELSTDEIKGILKEVSLKRIFKETGLAHIIFSFEFGEKNDEYSYTYVYIWVK